MSHMITDRYAVPNKYVHAEFGAIIRVLAEQNPSELYIQVSLDSEFPRWEKLGDMLTLAFSDFLEKEDFIKDCLKLFLHRESNVFINIHKLIKDPS